MRKFLSFLLVFAMLLALVACGSENSPSDPTDISSPSQTEPVVNPTTTPTESDSEESRPTLEPTTATDPSVPSECQHKFETTIISKSTCVDVGYVDSVCASCGETVREETPALGHLFGIDGLCSRCGEGDPNYNEGSFECEHDHRIVSQTEATCTKPGQTLYGCTKCNSAYTQTTPKKDHDYAAATCTKPSSCKLCGLSIGSALGHNYIISNKTQATCTTAGKITYTCEKCGDQYADSITASGHNFLAATCDNPKTCSVCSVKQGSALGHSYDSDHVCTRCGAKDPNTPTDVTVTIRSDKGALISGIRVSIYTGSNPQPDDTDVTNSNGQVSLQAGNISGGYQLVLSDVPERYIAKDSYHFSATTANITLSAASIISPTDHSNANYKVGSTMGAFTLTDTDGVSYTLSELLQTKKLVVLNFWFTACGPCNSEFPHFEAVYQKYKDQIALLALDPIDNEASIRNFKENNPYTFPMLSDSVKLAQGFGVIAYPTTVIISPSGTIQKIEVGAYTSAEAFEKDILQYLR